MPPPQKKKDITSNIDTHTHTHTHTRTQLSSFGVPSNYTIPKSVPSKTRLSHRAPKGCMRRSRGIVAFTSSGGAFSTCGCNRPTQAKACSGPVSLIGTSLWMGLKRNRKFACLNMWRLASLEAKMGQRKTKRKPTWRDSQRWAIHPLQAFFNLTSLSLRLSEAGFTKLCTGLPILPLLNNHNRFTLNRLKSHLKSKGALPNECLNRTWGLRGKEQSLEVAECFSKCWSLNLNCFLVDSL